MSYVTSIHFEVKAYIPSETLLKKNANIADDIDDNGHVVDFPFEDDSEV